MQFALHHIKIIICKKTFFIFMLKFKVKKSFSSKEFKIKK